jgi:Domain of unknown function (DUF4380)
MKTPWRMAQRLALVILSLGPINAWAATGEENLLTLHNGGSVVGILPEVGGRVMVYRTDAGENVLNGRPELWKTPTPEERAAWPWKWKQYFGESVWSGPQEGWWGPGNDWPPDPAWEMDAFTVVEKSATKAVLRSAISKQNGMELTKTLELLPDGRFKISVSALNRGDKDVTDRDLWLIVRPLPSARCFLPLKAITAEDGFTGATTRQDVSGLTVLERATDAPGYAKGKLRATATDGWIAAALPGCFLTVTYHPADPAKVVEGQAPVEVYFASEPVPLCELERHGESHTLKPGEAMTWEEVWQVVPYTGSNKVEDETKFLQERFSHEPNADATVVAPVTAPSTTPKTP